MRKCALISLYMRRPLVIYDFPTAPLWISPYMSKIWFSFLSVCAYSGTGAPFLPHSCRFGWSVAPVFRFFEYLFTVVDRATTRWPEAIPLAATIFVISVSVADPWHFWCGSGSGSADPCLWLMEDKKLKRSHKTVEIKVFLTIFA